MTADIEPITMTPDGVTFLERKLSERGKGVGIRIALVKQGCSGYKYEFDYVDAAQAEDYCFEVAPGLFVFVDPEAIEFLKGSRMDYRRMGMNAQWVFDNPNETGQCGCGESVNFQ